jgi:hypothetical protein
VLKVSDNGKPKGALPGRGCPIHQPNNTPRPINTDREPWERQRGESAQAFEAFAKYRDYGTLRSIAKVAKLLGKSTGLLHRWSSRWQWVERAACWDDELDKKARQEQISSVKAMYRKHARIAEGMLGVATSEINAMLEKVRQKAPLGLEHADLIRLIRVATALERISLGEPITILEERLKTEEVKSHEYVYKIIADPAASKLADELLQRAAAASPGQDFTSLVGLHGQRRAVAPFSPFNADEPGGNGYSKGEAE